MTSAEREIKEREKYSINNELFPVFLKLSELKTLIVGGGSVGLEKLNAVIKNSPAADVTLVAPSIRDEIFLIAEKFKNVRLINRIFLPEDLYDKDLVIAATNQKELNKIIKDEARSRKILTNVADTPDLCDFYLSSVVQKGSIKLAISTNGKSPTIAKRLREIFHNAIPDEMESTLDNLVKIRSKLNGNFSEKVIELNRITSVLVEEPKKKRNYLKLIRNIFYAFSLMFLGYFLFSNIEIENLFNTISQNLDPDFHWFLIAGFIAQLIDGALGMAYGVSATTFLLTLGLPPAVVSASVHTSEIFTCGASGLMHLKFGNVNKRLVKKLLLPGILGAVAGAFILSSLSDYNFIIKPLIALYTLTLGVIILSKALKNKREKSKVRYISPLAAAGGFFDSLGGGGWGPIVTSTLIAKGRHPHTTIGSVNLSEFFIAFSSSAAFLVFIGITHWQIIAGLILGGVIAAPIAAKAVNKIPKTKLMLLVGILVVAISLRIIIMMFI